MTRYLVEPTLKKKYDEALDADVYELRETPTVAAIGRRDTFVKR